MTSIAPATLQIARGSAAPPDHWRRYRRVLTHTHTYSGKADHGGTVRPPRSYRMLVNWGDQLGIEAIGMGSPYTPGSVEATQRARGSRIADEEPDIPRCDDQIAHMLEEVNHLSSGRTLFYLDNETPKGRFGHLWWVGYHLDLPASHDYDRLFDHWMCNIAAPGDDCAEPMPYTRRPYRQIVAMQRARGALGFWAHPTSWWWDREGRFITNIATEMPAHAIADGYLDGMVIMGYRTWRPEYMNVWFMLLDAGYRVTGVAEEDVGLSCESLWQRSEAVTNQVHIDGEELTVASLVKGFASGRVTASSGPQLELLVDDSAMGEVVRTSRDARHAVTIRLDPRGATGRLELVGRGGKTLWTREVEGPVDAELHIGGSDERGYLVARFVADETVRKGPAAITSPVYLHPPGQTFERPARTRLRLRIAASSPFRGGRVRFEEADGEPIGSATLTTDGVTETIPAGGRFTLVSPDGARHTEYLINANPPVAELQRYLYRGRFLRDFPGLQPGEAPIEAWRLGEFVEAMRELTLER